MAKIYTKTGDLGETSLVGGKRVSKAELRLNSYGTVDELNSVIGLLLAQIFSGESIKDKKLAVCTELLSSVQNSLFDIGSHLACENASIASKLPKINSAQVDQMESWIDSVTPDLKPLKNFILPGGSLPAAHAHLARTVARRAERIAVALSKKSSVDREAIIYLNRLSDFLFVVARYLNHLEKIEDVIWSAQKKKQNSTAK